MKSRRKKLFGAILFGIGVTVLVWHYKEPSESDAVMAPSKLAAVGSGVPGAAGPNAGSGPHIAGCPILPADNVWNTPIDTLKKDKHSDDYVQRMARPVLSQLRLRSHQRHPDHHHQGEPCAASHQLYLWRRERPRTLSHS